jgi:hypothetical protein
MMHRNDCGIASRPCATGDFGGSAHAELTLDEAAAVLGALRFTTEQISLDDDEQRLLLRLERL